MSSLGKELVQLGVTFTEELFRSVLLDKVTRFLGDDVAIENLLFDPESAIIYCSQVRQALGLSGSRLTSPLILRTLTNVRKQSRREDPTKRRSPPQPVRPLWQELIRQGITIGDEKFRLLIISELQKFLGNTDENLLFDPEKGIVFCNRIRYLIGPQAARLPNSLILRTMVNTRKASHQRPLMVDGKLIDISGLAAKERKNASPSP